MWIQQNSNINGLNDKNLIQFPSYSYSHYQQKGIEGSNSNNQQVIQLKQRIEIARQKNILYKQQLAKGIISQSSLSKGILSSSLSSDDDRVPIQMNTRYEVSNPSPQVINNSPKVKAIEPIENVQAQLEDSFPGNSTTSHEKQVKSTGFSDYTFKPTLVDYSMPIESKMKLNSLTSELNKTVESFSIELERVNNVQLSKEKLEKKRKNEENTKNRMHVESIIAKNQTNLNNTKMPRWRHISNGNKNPDPNFVLKGSKLFRLIAFAIVTMVTSPAHTISKRKLALRDAQMKEFQKTISISTDAFDEWLGKLAIQPIVSVIQDSSLNFEPKELTFVRANVPLKQRMVTLKVRIKAVIQNIINAKMPPVHISTFLASIIQDDNYFPVGYLWDIEKSVLSFNKLGATRDMIPIQMTEENKSSFLSDSFEEKLKTFNIEKIKILIIDILFIRSLILRIILSPWTFNLSSKPTNRNCRKVITNLRIVSSIIYMIFRKLNPNLPVIKNFQKIKEHEITNLVQNESLKNAPIDNNHKSGVLANMLKFIGLDDTTPAVDVFQQGSVEFDLLNCRLTPYDNIDQIHQWLFPPEKFRNIQSYIDDWTDEFVPILNRWIHEVIEHVIILQIQKKVELKT